MIQKQALIKLAQLRLAVNHVIRQRLIKQATNDDPSLLLYPLAGAGIGGGIGMLFGDNWKNRLWNGLTGAGIGGTAGLIAARNLRHKGSHSSNNSSSSSGTYTPTFPGQRERQERVEKMQEEIKRRKEQRKNKDSAEPVSKEEASKKFIEGQYN